MDMKVESEFIIFKGMAYRSDQPGMYAGIMKQNLMWFSHYIIGENMKDFRIYDHSAPGYIMMILGVSTPERLYRGIQPYF
jgi:hypothetical protein